ncbi:hypothetical protein, partial [Mesonia sp.]|uniref:hypothetical protein n=1 Tax=Mesonia sp. TaxID=1960830 RepID=UPI003F9A66EE
TVRYEKNVPLTILVQQAHCISVMRDSLLKTEHSSRNKAQVNKNNSSSKTRTTLILAVTLNCSRKIFGIDILSVNLGERRNG